ncbi:MAG: hypothetical protein M3024_12785 [Candidatus Dormibacteraeota bacterium]|nr:hypothetical protein [Candidatus Dormibacteraeota bacterium]
MAAPAAAPGSWRFADVRVAGGSAPGTAPVHAHRWPVGGRCAVVLTLDPEPPLTGATSHRLQVLPSWVEILAGIQRSPTTQAS